jgi:hypothetical protein
MSLSRNYETRHGIVRTSLYQLPTDNTMACKRELIIICSQINSRFLCGFLHYFRAYLNFRHKVIKLLLNQSEFDLFVTENNFSLVILNRNAISQCQQLHLVIESIDFDDVIIRAWLAWFAISSAYKMLNSKTYYVHLQTKDGIGAVLAA